MINLNCIKPQLRNKTLMITLFLITIFLLYVILSYYSYRDDFNFKKIDEVLKLTVRKSTPMPYYQSSHDDSNYSIRLICPCSGVVIYGKTCYCSFNKETDFDNIRFLGLSIADYYQGNTEKEYWNPKDKSLVNNFQSFDFIPIRIREPGIHSVSIALYFDEKNRTNWKVENGTEYIQENDIVHEYPKYKVNFGFSYQSSLDLEFKKRKLENISLIVGVIIAGIVAITQMVINFKKIYRN